jgi:hypothetical protein
MRLQKHSSYSTVMGVRGLTKFLQLNSLLSQRTISCGETKVIIVDGNGFVYWFFLKYNLISSADYTRAHEILMNFLATFVKVNIHLVFVFDGPMEIRKIRCKLERLSSQAQAAANIDLGNCNALPLPPLAFESILQCLHDNCSFIDSDGSLIFNGTMPHLCHLSGGEADQTIVKTAIRMGAYGIMSNDSDMVIYNTSPDQGTSILFIPLWSIEWSVDLPQIYFSAVDRAAVAVAFSLPQEV